MITRYNSSDVAKIVRLFCMLAGVLFSTACKYLRVCFTKINIINAPINVATGASGSKILKLMLLRASRE